MTSTHAHGIVRLKKAVLLLRVSTKEQLATSTDVDPEGLSIGTQRASGETKAAALGAEVVEVFIEPGYSAGKLTIDQRPVKLPNSATLCLDVLFLVFTFKVSFVFVL